MLTFAQPWVLAALLPALAAPILIHLISRHRALALRFPSIRFIPAAPLPQLGRRRLRDLLLLALRILLLCAAVLAFAQPRWQAETLPSASTEPPTLYLLDLSASMGGWGALDEARSLLREDLAATDAPVGLVAFARQLVLTLPLGTDPRGLPRVANDLEPTATAGNPARALAEARSLLDDLPAARIVILSDFQESDWAGVDLGLLPPRFQIDLQPVAQGARPNLTLASALAHPLDNERLQIVAQVASSYSEPREVQLQIPSERGSISAFGTVEPGQTTPLTLETSIPSDPNLVLELTNDDPFAADNTYHLWGGTPPPMEVLLLAPPSGDRAALGELFYISAALEVQAEGDWQRFEPTLAEPTLLASESLTLASAVFIPATAAGDVGLPWDLLADYVRSGGLLFVTLDSTAAPALRALGERGLAELSYLGLARRAPRDPAFAIAAPPAASHLAQIFAGNAARDLQLVRLERYVRIALAPWATPLLSTTTGDPLLARFDVGQGSVILGAFPLDNRWSDLPLRASFLPLVRELLLEPIGGESSLLRLDTGESLPEAFAAEVPISTDWPGTFALRGRPVEVNLPRRESVSATLRPEELRPARPSDLATTALPTPPGATELWPWLALAALAFLLLESLSALLRDRPRALETSPAT